MNGSRSGVEPIVTNDVREAARLWGIPTRLLDELAAVTDDAVKLHQRLLDLAVNEGTAILAPALERADIVEVLGTDPGRAWMFRLSEPTLGAAEAGPLHGQRLAVKDCIAVAGVPMTIGTSFFRHVPTQHASVVERALAHGATLEGTTVCESLCLSGSSFTSSTGPVPNPFDADRATGGSSSGSAAVIARGEADIALGTDLGGSVRNPAAWCGITALKPTFGVVPYTGAMATEITMDHIGLMARTASALEPFLLALAGPDEADSRQAGVESLLPAGNRNPRIALVAEGFGQQRADARIDRAVRNAAAILAALVAHSTLDEVSVPLHRHASDIHASIVGEGSLVTLFEQALQGSNHAGPYDPALAAAFAVALRDRPDQLPLNAMATLVATSVARRRSGGAVPAMAQPLRRRLRAQYDEALKHHDVLVMPTVPMLPHRLPTESLPLGEYRRLAFEMHDNNCATNLTGHPAVSVPCAVINGLPVGMMLIGRHRDDLNLLAIAVQFQAGCFAPPQVTVPADRPPNQGAKSA